VGPAILRLVIALLVLGLLWNLPVELGELRPGHVLALSLEAGGLLALLALLPFTPASLAGRALRHGLAGLTLLVVVLEVLDLAVRLSLGRPLSPWLDLHLAPSLLHLLTGTFEGPLAWLVLAGIVTLLAALFLLATTMLRLAQEALQDGRIRRVLPGAGAALVLLFALGEVLPRDVAGGWRPVSAHAACTLLEQAERTQALLALAGPFREAAADDAFRDAGARHLLAGLYGADVLLVYIESYGRSAHDDPRYGETLLPRLEAFEEAIAGRGLASASGWLTSPTVGGQSWLAHGTMQSGLWLPHHRYYELLLGTDRLTLTEAFNRAGWRTVALKPAITMPWPEGRRFGYDRIYAAADLGYEGLAYNWVTMPDQYTLAFLERQERGGLGTAPPAGERVPLFAEVSLISSHAPWTPIPPVLEWSAIGNGRVFSRWANEGDPPEVLWRDVGRVREHYALALDYVLATLAAYAARFVGDDTLLIMTGDHQSAPLITGEGASRAVPIHVVAGDPALLRPFRDWGFASGMRPAADAPVHRMDAFRDWFLGAFSRPDGGRVAVR